MDELVNTQLGYDNNYLVGVSVSLTKNSIHPIPKTYKKDFIVSVTGADDMKTPKELKLPGELEGILIYLEQVGRPQFTSSEFN